MPDNNRLKAEPILLGGLEFSPVELRVTTTKELVKAFRKGEPFIVDNKRLLFLVYIILWFLHAMYSTEKAFDLFSQADRLEFRHTEWRQYRTTQDEIIVIPRRPQAPSGLSEE
jgi:hypothetical protein